MLELLLTEAAIGGIDGGAADAAAASSTGMLGTLGSLAPVGWAAAYGTVRFCQNVYKKVSLDRACAVIEREVQLYPALETSSWEEIVMRDGGFAVTNESGNVRVVMNKVSGEAFMYATPQASIMEIIGGNTVLEAHGFDALDDAAPECDERGNLVYWACLADERDQSAA